VVEEVTLADAIAALHLSQPHEAHAALHGGELGAMFGHVGKCFCKDCVAPGPDAPPPAQLPADALARGAAVVAERTVARAQVGESASAQTAASSLEQLQPAAAAELLTAMPRGAAAAALAPMADAPRAAVLAAAKPGVAGRWLATDAGSDSASEDITSPTVTSPQQRVSSPPTVPPIEEGAGAAGGAAPEKKEGETEEGAPALATVARSVMQLGGMLKAFSWRGGGGSL
jgi:hypothetical protein